MKIFNRRSVSIGLAFFIALYQTSHGGDCVWDDEQEMSEYFKGIQFIRLKLDKAINEVTEDALKNEKVYVIKSFALFSTPNPLSFRTKKYLFLESIPLTKNPMCLLWTPFGQVVLFEDGSAGVMKKCLDTFLKLMKDHWDIEEYKGGYLIKSIDGHLFFKDEDKESLDDVFYTELSSTLEERYETDKTLFKKLSGGLDKFFP